MLTGNPPSPGNMMGSAGSTEPPAEDDDEDGVSLDLSAPPEGDEAPTVRGPVPPDDAEVPDDALPEELCEFDAEVLLLLLPELWDAPLAPDADDCGDLAPWREDQSWIESLRLQYFTHFIRSGFFN